MNSLRLIVCMILLLGLAMPAQAETLAKHLFGAKQQGSEQNPQTHGIYFKGCLAGGSQLPESGPTWQSMRLSRNRHWAHPEAIDFIKKLSAFAAQQPGWKGLYIGDISQPRGGPMTSSHRSHQVGLDIDIWMLPASRINLSRKQRESISSISVTTGNQAFVNDNWSRAHFRILREAAKDRRVARIFVSPGIKVQLCNEETGNRKWLRTIRMVNKHNYHFHVRMNCPKGSSGCEEQSRPPRGDGCAEAQTRVNNILNPPPPKKADPNAPKPKPRQPRREYVLADLPKQCTGVLQSN